jgi:hypothetical protein
MAKATERIASDLLAAGREHLADAEREAARKRMARTDHIQRARRSQFGRSRGRPDVEQQTEEIS